jgi:septum formation protein
MDWINDQRKIILGSGSPRRAELLKLAGYRFIVRTQQIDETFPEDMDSDKVAEYLAIKKARVQESLLGKKDLLITADSVVIQNEKILGKPQDKRDAREMLAALSAHEHQVITGVCLLSQSKMKSFSSCSRVWMERLREVEIEHYIEHYQPYDKAGSYGIQEWIGINRIKKIEGSYTNIMGLPMAELYEEILDF